MRKKVNKKLIVALLSFVLLFGGTFGSSLAWLLDKTENVENTFSTSDIDVELKETENEFKMVPGHSIDKDPIVTVAEGSEDSMVFIKVEESSNLKDYIVYKINEGNWTLLEETEDEKTGKVTKIYYSNPYFGEEAKGKATKILDGGTYIFTNGTEDTDDDITYEWTPNQVLTKPEVTKEMMEDLKKTGAEQPTLTFTAYATQYWKDNDTPFTPQDAWKIVGN